eukprot:4357499-Prymnesium_polylepis.2
MLHRASAPLPTVGCAPSWAAQVHQISTQLHRHSLERVLLRLHTADEGARHIESARSARHAHAPHAHAHAPHAHAPCASHAPHAHAHASRLLWPKRPQRTGAARDSDAHVAFRPACGLTSDSAAFRLPFRPRSVHTVTHSTPASFRTVSRRSCKPARIEPADPRGT